MKQQNTTTMTTLKEISSQLPELVREIFETSFISLVDIAVMNGESIKDANRTAFNILIKNGGLENILNKLN